jgi:hypothetical protein
VGLLGKTLFRTSEEIVVGLFDMAAKKKSKKKQRCSRCGKVGTGHNAATCGKR